MLWSGSEGTDAELMQGLPAARATLMPTLSRTWAGPLHRRALDAMAFYDKADFNGTGAAPFAGNFHSTGANEGRAATRWADTCCCSCTVTLDRETAVGARRREPGLRAAVAQRPHRAAAAAGGGAPLKGGADIAGIGWLPPATAPRV